VRVRVLAAGVSASTRELVRRVKELCARDSREYARRIGVQAEASERAADALVRGDARAFVRALGEQSHALAELGRAAGVAIVTPELEALCLVAEAQNAVVLPAGAGGGDIALWVSVGADEALLPGDSGFEPLDVSLGAPGVHRVG
jgi:mevalonate kinase